jgi:hypothetical protein
MSKTKLGAWSIALPVLLALPLSAVADTRITETLKLDPGGRLLVDTDCGAIAVRGTSQSGARIVITSSRDDLESQLTFAFEQREGEVQIVARKKGGGGLISSWFSSSCRGALLFDVEVPHATAVMADTAGGAIDLEGTRGEARLDTSGGSISVTDVKGAIVADTSGGSIDIENVEGDVNADTSGGPITVRSVRGDVRADTSGGSISVVEATGDVQADTSGGSIEIREAGGRVVADTSGGGVQVSFARGNARGGTISTSGGGIRVALDPSIDLTIDASASGGTVSSELPLKVKGEASRSILNGMLGSGGAKLVIEASGGGIRIEEL